MNFGREVSRAFEEDVREAVSRAMLSSEEEWLGKEDEEAELEPEDVALGKYGLSKGGLTRGLRRSLAALSRFGLIGVGSAGLLEDSPAPAGCILCKSDLTEGEELKYESIGKDNEYLDIRRTMHFYQKYVTTMLRLEEKFESRGIGHLESWCPSRPSSWKTSKTTIRERQSWPSTAQVLRNRSLDRWSDDTIPDDSNLNIQYLISDYSHDPFMMGYSVMSAIQALQKPDISFFSL